MSSFCTSSPGYPDRHESISTFWEGKRCCCQHIAQFRNRNIHDYTTRLYKSKHTPKLVHLGSIFDGKYIMPCRFQRGKSWMTQKLSEYSMQPGICVIHLSLSLSLWVKLKAACDWDSEASRGWGCTCFVFLWCRVASYCLGGVVVYWLLFCLYSYIVICHCEWLFAFRHF